MTQYIVRLSHTSDQCPSANAKVRERAVKGATEIPKLAEKLGVRFIAGPLVAATEHEAFAVVEAAKPETVHDFIVHAGLGQWNTVRVTPAQSLADALKDMEKMPPPLY